MFIRYQHLFIALTLVSASACGSEPPPLRLTDTAFSSECGGHEGQLSALQPAGEYCDAERIHWSYDGGTGMLKFLHARYETNCCAERLVHAQLDGTEYQIVETELPLYGDEPCGCTCVFDVALDVPIPDEPSIELSVILDGQTAWDKRLDTLWSGTLDLTAGAGEIVLSDEPSSSCKPVPAQ
jgi:hypothetical protein